MVYFAVTMSFTPSHYLATKPNDICPELYTLPQKVTKQSNIFKYVMFAMYVRIDEMKKEIPKA